MTYEVGRFYVVPCVLGKWRHLTRYWPVMGSQHEDREHLDFPHQHYHIDWRFVGRPDIDWFGAALQGHTDHDGLAANYGVPLMVGPRINVGGLPKPVLRRRKCHREHVLPFHRVARGGWQKSMETAYVGCKLAAGRVCPHRGYDLSREPVNADGTITCPLHGLRWNAATGELVPRNPESSGCNPPDEKLT